MFRKQWFLLLSFLVGMQIQAQDSNGILVKLTKDFHANLSANEANFLMIDPGVNSVVKLSPKGSSKKCLPKGPNLPGSWYWVRLNSEFILPRVIEKFRQLENVELAEPNRRCQISGKPDDPFFTQQWALQKNGIAWDQISTTEISAGEKIVVGLLDTGIDRFHPDLAPNLWENQDEIPGNDIDDDQNGYVDDCFGWDFSAGDNQPLPEKMPSQTGDYGWHGTHCAGILAAVTNNHEGISGVSPCVQVMPLKIFPQAWFSTIIKAIYYAVENKARILTNSWGSTFGSQAVLEALRFAIQNDMLCFFAAGNQAQDACFFPAFYPEVVAVGACDQNGQRAWFSNFGEWVDFAAPGVDILSTGPTNYGSFPKYFFHSGTSMATPFVAGLAALLMVRQPEWTNEEILQQMRHTANYLPDANLGAGSIDAHLALTCAPESTLTLFNQVLPRGVRFQKYQAKLKAFAGSPPYRWFLENPAVLPDGLDFKTTGEITGVPQEACGTRLLISVRDRSGRRIEFARELEISAQNFLTEIETEPSAVPPTAKITGNYPNPFAPTRQSTSIAFTIPEEDFIQLEIFNILGQCVRQLTTDHFPAGQHILNWDGRDDKGNFVSQGKYYYHLSGQDFQRYRAILILE